MTNDVLMSFGNRLRSLRSQRELSQEEFAARAGVHRTYVGMVERAEKNITLRNIHRFAKALEITESQLLDFQKETDGLERK